MIGDIAPWFPATAATITVGAAIVGAILAVGKLGPERGKVTVDAAQGAVIVQTGVINNLQEENERLQARVEQLERSMMALAEAQKRITQLTEENQRLHVALDAAKARIATLELEVAELKNGR